MPEQQGSEWDPDEVSLARIADWLLGGTQHWPIDRAAGWRLLRISPDAGEQVREGRLLQQRAVRYALDNGVRQFVDLASGLPTQGCVHETADEHAPQCSARVVYADCDQAVSAHARRLLTDGERGARFAAVQADLLRSVQLWGEVLDTGRLSLDEPVCLFATGVLHFIKDWTGVHEQFARYRERLPAGSLLVLSHATDEGIPDSPIVERAAEFHAESDPGQLRGRAEFAELFGDFRLEEPGIVFAPRWHPELGRPGPFGGDPAGSYVLAAAGRKR